MAGDARLGGGELPVVPPPPDVGAEAEWVSRPLVHTVAVVAWGVTALLTVLSAFLVVLDGSSDLFHTFNVGDEANVPAWWNATLLLACSGVAATVALLARSGRRPGRPSRTLWWWVAAGFAALSLDELVSLHERLGVVGYWAEETFGVPVPAYAWLGPGLALAVVGGAFFLRWLRRLPRDVRTRVGLGATAVVVGAFGLEAAAGLAWRGGDVGLMYAATAVEELLEMGGTVLALLGLLRLLVVVDLPTGHRTRSVLALRDDML